MSDHPSLISWLLDHTMIRWLLDITSAVAIVTTIAGWLPPVAAVLGIAWYCVLFWDRFFGRDKTK